MTKEEEVLKAVYVSVTKKNIKIVSSILYMSLNDSEAANIICEELGIEKIENRAIIFNILRTNNPNNQTTKK